MKRRASWPKKRNPLSANATVWVYTNLVLRRFTQRSPCRHRHGDSCCTWSLPWIRSRLTVIERVWFESKLVTHAGRLVGQNSLGSLSPFEFLFFNFAFQYMGKEGASDALENSEWARLFRVILFVRARPYTPHVSLFCCWLPVLRTRSWPPWRWAVFVSPYLYNSDTAHRSSSCWNSFAWSSSNGCTTLLGALTKNTLCFQCKCTHRHTHSYRPGHHAHQLLHGNTSCDRSVHGVTVGHSLVEITVRL